MGETLALKAWYCDSTHRYTMTDAVQPLPITQRRRQEAGDNPKADLRRYFMLAHGSHLVDTARLLAGDIVEVSARLTEKFGAYCWFVEIAFANGAVGHLDLTVAVRMDWHEGLQLYGENGSVSPGPSTPGTSSPPRSTFSARRMLPGAARSGRTDISIAASSKVLPTPSSTAHRCAAPMSQTAWLRSAPWRPSPNRFAWATVRLADAHGPV